MAEQLRAGCVPVFPAAGGACAVRFGTPASPKRRLITRFNCRFSPMTSGNLIQPAWLSLNAQVFREQGIPPLGRTGRGRQGAHRTLAENSARNYVAAVRQNIRFLAGLDAQVGSRARPSTVCGCSGGRGRFSSRAIRPASVRSSGCCSNVVRKVALWPVAGSCRARRRLCLRSSASPCTPCRAFRRRARGNVQR